jgi:hypothetical protein
LLSFPAAYARGKHVLRVSEFYGIVIVMYYNDHGLPHFHARHAARKGKVVIATGDVIGFRSIEPRQTASA